VIAYPHDGEPGGLVGVGNQLGTGLRAEVAADDPLPGLTAVPADPGPIEIAVERPILHDEIDFGSVGHDVRDGVMLPHRPVRRPCPAAA